MIRTDALVAELNKHTPFLLIWSKSTHCHQSRESSPDWGFKGK